MNKSDCCNAEVTTYLSKRERLDICSVCDKKCTITKKGVSNPNGIPRDNSMPLKAPTPFRVNPLGVHIAEKMDKTTFKKPKVTKYYQVKSRIQSNIYMQIITGKNPIEAENTFKLHNPRDIITDIKLIEIITEDNPE